MAGGIATHYAPKDSRATMCGLVGAPYQTQELGRTNCRRCRHALTARSRALALTTAAAWLDTYQGIDRTGVRRVAAWLRRVAEKKAVDRARR